MFITFTTDYFIKNKQLCSSKIPIELNGQIFSIKFALSSDILMLKKQDNGMSIPIRDQPNMQDIIEYFYLNKKFQFLSHKVQLEKYPELKHIFKDKFK